MLPVLDSVVHPHHPFGQKSQFCIHSTFAVDNLIRQRRRYTNLFVKFGMRQIFKSRICKQLTLTQQPAPDSAPGAGFFV